MLDPVETPAKLRAHGSRARVGGVDVEPDTRLTAARAELAHRIDGGGRGAADRRDDCGRVVEREVGDHPELGVDRDGPVFEPEDPRRLLDREVRVLGGVDDPAGPDRPGGGEGGERRGRRRVLDVAVQAGGSPRSWASQSSTTCSSSVAAGEVSQAIAFTLSAAVRSSARIPGSEPVFAK